MERADWQCLNGLWSYAFCKDGVEPKDYDGEILVPFSPETRLSGVERQLLPDMVLWYKRTVYFTERTKACLAAGGRLLLHFGAVDQSCEIYVNGKKAGGHTGGYLPFTLDITDILESQTTGKNETPQESVATGKNETSQASQTVVKNESCTITVRVVDVSDTSFYSVGKQTLKPGGMYYPATSGIWQTVWMEAVPKRYIADIGWQTDYDAGKVILTAKIAGGKPDGRIKVRFPNGEYPESEAAAGAPCEIALPGFKSWSPEDPYLYRVVVELYGENSTEALDVVESYFAMRKCVIDTDEKGIRRIFLNNRPCMQVGVLDQGYWPESMYTAPSDEAMIYDIRTMKDLGFNMLRKHVKVEPDRWYYHCDRLGMLVWQDMINGGRRNKGWYVTYLATAFQLLGISPGDRHPILLSRQDREGRKAYERELRELVGLMQKHPSVVCIVPFNEGWGQFETERMTALIKELAPDMLADQASGWFDMGGGDFKSLHYYFFRLKYKKESRRALALTEFGGYARKVSGHTAHEEEYGYKTFEDKKALEAGYEELIRETILPAVRDGISATIYTQLSDVEEEINGILTYDREVLKMDGELVRRLNEALREWDGNN